MNKKTVFFGLVGLLASLLSTSAHAVASMSFSGGVNSPVVFTLNQSVQYTITTTPVEKAPFFLFEDVGDLFSFPIRGQVSGTMTYSVNGGTMLTLSVANSGVSQGELTPSDLYFFGPNRADPVGWLVVGDVVTLWSGQLTTADSFAFAPPSNGDFSTFIFDAVGTAISTDGVSVSPIPEPETYALMLAGLALVGAAARRRKAM